jgi:hypothetical protein
MNIMKHNLVSNFSDFSYSLNEGNSFKKNFGIIGPFDKWGYKMKSCCPEMGGIVDSNSVIASDVSSDLPNLCLKYIYGDNQESEPIYFPKDAFIVSGDSKNPIIEAISNKVFCGVRMGGMGVAIGSKAGEDLAELASKTN